MSLGEQVFPFYKELTDRILYPMSNTKTMGTEQFRIRNFNGNHTISPIISVYLIQPELKKPKNVIKSKLYLQTFKFDFIRSFPHCDKVGYFDALRAKEHGAIRVTICTLAL